MASRVKTLRAVYGPLMDELERDDPEAHKIIAEYVHALGMEVSRWRTMAQALRRHLGIHPDQVGTGEPATLEQLYDRLGIVDESVDRLILEE